MKRSSDIPTALVTEGKIRSLFHLVNQPYKGTHCKAQ